MTSPFKQYKDCTIHNYKVSSGGLKLNVKVYDNIIYYMYGRVYFSTHTVYTSWGRALVGQKCIIILYSHSIYKHMSFACWMIIYHYFLPIVQTYELPWLDHDVSLFSTHVVYSGKKQMVSDRWVAIYTTSHLQST